MNSAVTQLIATHACISAGLETVPDDELTPDELAEELRQEMLFRGLFSYAATLVVSDLLQDIVALRAKPRSQINKTRQLRNLPEAYTTQYDLRFAQQFLLSVADVARKYTEGWSLPENTAQELAVKLIVDEAERVREEAGVDLTEDYVAEWFDRMLEDTDFLWLFHLEVSAVRNDLETHMWFMPFDVDAE